jgi:imidazoleglycerol-phosphate dehydratase
MGDKAGIRRFGDALVPLDECLVQVAVDLSGRPYLVHEEPAVMETAVIGRMFPGTLVRHVWEAFTVNSSIALHILVRSGRDPHHIAEAQFKAVARALRDATALDPRVKGIPSTKGRL